MRHNSPVHVQMYTLLFDESSENLSYHNYQGHCILPCLSLTLEALGKQSFKIEVELI